MQRGNKTRKQMHRHEGGAESATACAHLAIIGETFLDPTHGFCAKVPQNCRRNCFIAVFRL